jgi:hypothetical protein
MTDKLKVDLDGPKFQGINVPIHFPTKVAWPNGFIESPTLPATKATKEEGEQMLDAIAQFYADFLREFKKASFPTG